MRSLLCRIFGHKRPNETEAQPAPHRGWIECYRCNRCRQLIARPLSEEEVTHMLVGD